MSVPGEFVSSEEHSFVTRYLPVGVVWLLILTTLGCGSTPKIGQVPPASRNLRMLGDAYVQATDKMNRPPANFQELLPYLKEQGDPEELKRSPGDNEEFVIFWNVDYRSYGQAGAPYPLLAFEKEGKSGKRWVFVLMNMMTILDANEMKTVPLPKGQQLPF